MGLRLCSPALQVLAGGFASSETLLGRSALWFWASGVFRRGTANALVCEMGSWVTSWERLWGKDRLGF